MANRCRLAWQFPGRPFPGGGFPGCRNQGPQGLPGPTGARGQWVPRGMPQARGPTRTNWYHGASGICQAPPGHPTTEPQGQDSPGEPGPGDQGPMGLPRPRALSRQHRALPGKPGTTGSLREFLRPAGPPGWGPQELQDLPGPKDPRDHRATRDLSGSNTGAWRPQGLSRHTGPIGPRPGPTRTSESRASGRPQGLKEPQRCTGHSGYHPGATGADWLCPGPAWLSRPWCNRAVWCDRTNWRRYRDCRAHRATGTEASRDHQDQLVLPTGPTGTQLVGLRHTGRNVMEQPTARQFYRCASYTTSSFLILLCHY